MISLHFILILAIGSIAGWLAGQITGHGTKGLAVDMLVGCVGAALATMAFPGLMAWGRLPAILAGSIFFSVLLLMAVRVFRKARIERLRALPRAAGRP